MRQIHSFPSCLGVTAVLVSCLALGGPGTEAESAASEPQSLSGRWVPVGPPGSGIGALVAEGGILYVTTSEAGILVSKDGGRHWRSGNDGIDLASGLPFLLTADPERPSLLYASDGRRVWRSFDGANTWQPLPLPCGAFLEEIAVSPSRPQRLYSKSVSPGAPGFASLGTSTDRGTTWSCERLPSLDFAGLSVDPGAPETLYFAAREHLAKSVDGGLSWMLLGPAWLQFVFAVAVDPTSPRTLYAAGFGVIGKSANAGRTWRPLRAGLAPDALFDALVVDPSQPSILYAGASGGSGKGAGVFLSTDAGETWTHMSRGLPRANFTGVMAFDASTGALYAGTLGHGLYAFRPAR